MNTLHFAPAIRFDRQVTRQKRANCNRDSDTRRDRRQRIQRRSGIADKRQLQTYYPDCRRKQVADRRRMNGDRRYAFRKQQDNQPVRAKMLGGKEIRKGQLIDIAV